MDTFDEGKRFNPVRRENQEIFGERFSGERALYRGRNLQIFNSVFHDGESALKESERIVLYRCSFEWKYPIWYSNGVLVKDCVWKETGRSGVWYTKNIKVEECRIGAPKNFRRCKNVAISDTTFSDAAETMWMCDGVRLENVSVRGDYFGMNSKNVSADNLEIVGNYAFDGAKNVEIRNSRLETKDCFWNCENVSVYDSVIVGEYLAWNTKNLTLVNCTIESNQGLCYIKNLKIEDCSMPNTSLAFEYVEKIDAKIDGRIDSVLNPGSGRIVAGEIGELIVEKDNCDISKTEFVAR